MKSALEQLLIVVLIVAILGFVVLLECHTSAQFTALIEAQSLVAEMATTHELPTELGSNTVILGEERELTEQELGSAKVYVQFLERGSVRITATGKKTLMFTPRFPITWEF